MSDGIGTLTENQADVLVASISAMKRQADEYINASGSGWNLAQKIGLADIYRDNLQSMQKLIELRVSGGLDGFTEGAKRLERIIEKLPRLETPLGDKSGFAVAFFNAAIAIIKTPNADLAIPNTTSDSLKNVAIRNAGLFMSR